MDTVTLKATVRQNSGKGPARQLRKVGKIPSIAYGPGMDTLSLAVVGAELRSILLSDRGRNTIISLEVDDGTSHEVMVKEYTVHPLSRDLLHADFIRIVEGKPITCEVPFVTTGKSKGEQEGGTLLANVRTLPVRCLPKAIPDKLEFDVSELKIDDVVRVQELTVPEGIEVLLPAERKIVVVAPPRVIEQTEEEAAAAAAAAAEGAEGAEAPAEGGEAGGDAG